MNTENREIDYICHQCQQPVYVVSKGAFSLGHQCLTEEEREARAREIPFAVIKVERRFVPVDFDLDPRGQSIVREIFQRQAEIMDEFLMDEFMDELTGAPKKLKS